MSLRLRSSRPQLARQSKRFIGVFCAVAGTFGANPSHAANPAEVLELPQVLIVGTTPLPGSGVEVRKLPANVQIFTSDELRRQRAGSLSEFLDQNASGITVNAAQGNPHQPDLNFRGFTASPLLGTPQGLSVFFDGVRINEPFGDAVNWDLFPQSAISSLQLIPGSNPAFGLNTLGGAVAIYSKSGASEYPDQPGGSVTLSGGSFGRRTLGFEAGGRSGPWDYFITGNDVHDAGWARHNASLVRQLFAKVGWQNERTDIDFSFSTANNRLEGTQTVPLSFTDIRAPYTYPDQNLNQVGFAALKGSHALSDTWLLSGNAYWRSFRNRNLSSNVRSDAPPGAAQATNDAALIEQNGQGIGLQLAYTGKLAGRTHKFTLGTSLDEGRARFSRRSQDAMFSADRGTVGMSAFMPDTDADSRTRHHGVFASSSLDLDRAARWTLTLAGRANRADVSIADRSGNAPELNGDHRFTRFNPAVGLNFNPSREQTFYASYNEGMRAPTAIELTCADPNAPCKLPNSFLADPPLKKVVSKTLELGARGQWSADTRWSASIFRTELHDDLQFVSSSGVALNSGYFQNVGGTRRQGLELSASTRVEALKLSAHYSFIDATFRSGFVENSPNHSTADANGAIVVSPGDRMPSIPRQALKLRGELSASPAWQVGANLQLASAIYARGDENNRDASGGVPGYALLNLDTRYALTPRWKLFARVDNVLNRTYANFAILGQNVFTGPGQSYDAANPRTEQFRGHGTPRGAWVGVEYRIE